MTTEMIERILSKENLEEAKCKVMSNKGSAGVDRMKTSELPKLIEAHGEELSEAKSLADTRSGQGLLPTTEGDFLAGSERSGNRNLRLPAVL